MRFVSLQPRQVHSIGLAYGAYFSPLWNWITGTYSAPYADAVRTVYERVNFNAGWHNLIVFVDTYTMSDVETIMNVYGNLAADGKIPEYYDDDTDGKKKKLIIDAVTKASLLRTELVQVVMYEWFWATKDGSVPGEFIFPSSAKKTEDIRTQPPPAGKGWLGGAEDLLMWGLGLGAVAIVISLAVRR